VINRIRSKAFWQFLTVQYPRGGQWPHDSENLVLDTVVGIRDELIRLNSPVRVRLEFRSVKRKPGFKKPPIKAITIIDGAMSRRIRVKVSKSSVVIGGRTLGLGHEGAVVALANRIMDEVENVTLLS
jgi:hypothetical protein